MMQYRPPLPPVCHILVRWTHSTDLGPASPWSSQSPEHVTWKPIPQGPHTVETHGVHTSATTLATSASSSRTAPNTPAMAWSSLGPMDGGQVPVQGLGGEGEHALAMAWSSSGPAP